MRKKLMLCVLPGVLDVRAKPLRCSKELISEDFPTFERPKKAISGNPSVVQCSSAKALLINSVEVIFIFQRQYWIRNNSTPRRRRWRQGNLDCFYGADRILSKFRPFSLRKIQRSTNFAPLRLGAEFIIQYSGYFRT